MAKETHRYRIKAKVRASFQYDDNYMICKPSEVSGKVEEWIIHDVDVELNYGGKDIKKENIELSNLEVTDLGPCTIDFYETGEC